MFVPPDRLDALRPDDQFLVSYPRSGNTWVRHLLRDVIALDRPQLPYPEELWMLIPDLHRSEHPMVYPDTEQFEMPTRILKSHNLNKLGDRRFVYIVRSPADALVSYYHFHRLHRLPLAAGVDDIDAFCRIMVNGWVGHVSIALARYRKRPSDVHIVTYENLMADGLPELRRIAEFLGLSPGDETLSTALERNAFTQLRAREISRRGESAEYFYRKGRTGTAQEEITRKTLDMIEAAAGEMYRHAQRAASRPLGGRAVVFQGT